MIDDAAPFGCPLERIQIAEVSGDELYVECFEIISAAG